MTIIVNGEVVKGDRVAYDGCHKIYVLENGDEVKDAIKLGYNIYSIDKLQEIYDGSCPLRFVNNWKCTIRYCGQFENAKIVIKED